MLVNFRFKNFRSFYEESILSMQATSDTELEGINTVDVNDKILNKGENSILKSAVIFGANASGKSNVLKALSYMKNIVLLSASVPIVANNTPFAFYEDANLKDTLFEVELIQNGTFYRYGFIICDGMIRSEWLSRREKRLTEVFRRDGENLKINSEENSLSKYITLYSDKLFLSSNIMKLKINRYLADVINWFRNLLIVFENNPNSFDIYTAENGKYKKQALEVLKHADIGIQDFNVKKDKIAEIKDTLDILRFNTQLQTASDISGQIKREENTVYNIDIETDFNMMDSDGNIVGKKSIRIIKDHGFNSDGTERLLSYLGWILAALDRGLVIIIDEMDAKLHFCVAAFLINLFNSINNNPYNAQLICTTHSAPIMDKDLRRDQIYFTYKNEKGESFLSSLSDYKNVRKDIQFSKKYLAGFYTDIPDMRSTFDYD